jgi:small subunit ribosomal protein S6e
MTFKIVVSDPKTRKAYQKEVPQSQSGLLGRKIGDKVSGDFLGMAGYELEVTGGSDKQGFPMRKDVHGSVRKKVLLSFPPGFHPLKSGQRRKKSVRGNTISSEIIQVNAKVLKYGNKSIEELFGVKKEKPKEEAKAEKPKEAEKTEKHKEEKAEKKEEAKAEKHKEEAKHEEKHAKEEKHHENPEVKEEKHHEHHEKPEAKEEKPETKEEKHAEKKAEHKHEEHKHKEEAIEKEAKKAEKE